MCLPALRLLSLALAFSATSVLAQTAPAAASAPAKVLTTGIASFNMGWAGTPAEFRKHVEVCGAPSVNWCDTRPRWERGTTTASDAEKERAAKCQEATIAAAGGKDKSMMVPPCNAYRAPRPAPGQARINPNDSRKPEAYQEKIAQLTSTIENLIDKEGVRVIAFQEVSGAEVIKLVLGKYAGKFEVCAAKHNAFQTLAFAWDKTVTSKPGVCATEDKLAVLDPPGDPAAFRRVRPGLALELVINNAPVTFMNVHLKSGCANVVATDRYAARLLDDAFDACDVLNRQVAPLEEWIEAVAAKSPRFVWLGDFNRRIDEEEAANIPKDKVRTDGSDPAKPNKPVNGKVPTRYLWPELNDGTLVMFQIPLSTQEGGCKGFSGLDHIVISEALKKINEGVVFSKKVGVFEKDGQAIETSDHCPRIAQLKF